MVEPSLRFVEFDLSAFEVDVLPGEGVLLRQTHSGSERDRQFGFMLREALPDRVAEALDAPKVAEMLLS